MRAYLECYGAFLVIIYCLLWALTLDYPDDFWRVFLVEAVGGLFLNLMWTEGYLRIRLRRI